MNKESQLIGTWIGLATIVLFGMAFYPFAGFIPPLSPTLTSNQVAAYYQLHTNGIRLGMVFMEIAASTMCVFVAVVAMQLKRIEKAETIWSYTQIVAGCMGAVTIIIGAMLMTATAFRPDRPPEITYMMFDISWLWIIMPGTPAVIQTLAIGLAILGDKNSTPVFPRWLGFFSVWAAIVYSPGVFATFFKTGPLAWDGVFAFWLPASTFGVWYLIMFFMLRKAIHQQV
jgi:hypothetical protein